MTDKYAKYRQKCAHCGNAIVLIVRCWYHSANGRTPCDIKNAPATFATPEPSLCYACQTGDCQTCVDRHNSFCRCDHTQKWAIKTFKTRELMDAWINRNRHRIKFGEILVSTTDHAFVYRDRLALLGEKQAVEHDAMNNTQCPTCGVSPGRRCINTKADEKGRHRPVPVHRKRVTAYLIW